MSRARTTNAEDARPLLRDMDDRALLDAALARDPRSWRALVRLHEATLGEAIRDTGGKSVSEHEVEDLLGDFWLFLLEDDMARLRGFRCSDGEDLGAWLVLVVSELTRKELRRRKRLPEKPAFLTDSVETRIANAVIREMQSRGIVRAHDQAVPSSGTAKEGTCQDDATTRTGFLDRSGFQREKPGESSYSRQRQRIRRTDELLDTIATRLKRMTP